jgi:hypothetical protein
MPWRRRGRRHQPLIGERALDGKKAEQEIADDMVPSDHLGSGKQQRKKQGQDERVAEACAAGSSPTRRRRKYANRLRTMPTCRPMLVACRRTKW